MADSNSLGKGQPTLIAAGGGVHKLVKEIVGKAPRASTANSNLLGCSGVSLCIFVALLSNEVLMSNVYTPFVDLA